MPDNKTPKTFEDWLSQAIKDSVGAVSIEEAWSAATEATRSEYEDKIKAMQAETNKLKNALSDIANHNTLNGGKYNNYTEAYFGVVDFAKRKLEELNQRGKDE